MKKRFIYPVDTDQFEAIRQDGKLYVDKTGMVYDLVTRYNYVFLSRPRRFGKSLLCNTLKAYFEGKKELFEGLSISDLEKEWKSYPVFHFKMSGLKNVTVEEARGKLGNSLSVYERIFGRDESQLTPGARFSGLLLRSHEQTGSKAVVILDEYDTPILNLLYQQRERDAMRGMLREFYQVLKDEGEHIRFVFITGITRFSQLSIFSELNNLKNISMLPEYSGLCGFTKEEMETTLRPCMEDFAGRYGCSTDDAYGLFQRQYDGYHFCKGGEDVYAPFSVLNALSDGDIRDYWFTGATPSSLIENLKHYPVRAALEYDGIQVDLDEFDRPCEDAPTPMPLLYQGGYLSIDSYDRRLNAYTIHFPNQEVRNSMVKCLMPMIVLRPESDNNSLVMGMSRSLFEGSISDALLHLRSYIAGIPYDVITKEEWKNKQKRESFYQLLLYMVFSMLNSNVECESRCILGRADVVIKTEADIFILELKVDGTVDNALAQISDRGYAIRWSSDGRRITRCGAVIDSRSRNLTNWRVVDESGVVVDEKNFQTPSDSRLSSDSMFCEPFVDICANTIHNGHEYVDLGLPSGTLWATCNLGASKPSEYGDYFAWGETKPKDSYNWENLAFRTEGDSYDNVKFSKYVVDKKYGKPDGRELLEIDDDAVRANWGGEWRMPAQAEWRELINHCDSMWTIENGVEGRRLTSKNNGNSIFLSAAGLRNGDDSVYGGRVGCYWSSSLHADTSYNAFDCYFNYGVIAPSSWLSRCYGLSVRPVLSSSSLR